MAGVEVLLVFVLIVVALVAVFYGQASELWTSILNTSQATTASNYLQINPSPGQTTCDLKIVFAPQLVVSSNPTFIGLLAGIPGWSLPYGASYSWQNCHQYGNPFTMSFIPFSYLGGTPQTTPQAFTPNDIVWSGGQTVHWNLVVQSPNGGLRSYTTDPFCTQYCTSITINAGATYVPKQYTFTFVITNLPKQSYVVQATSDIPINGQSTGQPYLQNVS